MNDPVLVATTTPSPNQGQGSIELFGFRLFVKANSKGHEFEIWLRPPLKADRFSWKAAVLSRGHIDFATAYVVDAVLRASVPISDPRGHLLFRADTDKGVPTPRVGFQIKFGAA